MKEENKDTLKDEETPMMEKVVNAVIGFSKSMKVAVALILVITILAMLSTLIPQGKNEDFYTSRYPVFLSYIILKTGFHNFYSSWLFLGLAVAFTINLLTCTVERLAREFRKKMPFRFGPDMIHIGIIVLIIGSVVSFTARVEEFAYLGEGDTIGILDTYVLMVEKCEYIQYENGRPKDWISTVSVFKDNEKIISSFQIEVNKPLNFRGIEILQSSYSDEPMLIVADMDGKEYRWVPGNMIKTDQSTILFHGINSDPWDPGQEGDPWDPGQEGDPWDPGQEGDPWDPGQEGDPRKEDDKIALFEENFPDNTRRFIYAKPLDIIGETYIIKELYIRDITGLQFIIDPGYLTVIIGLILIGLGLSLTFIQKIGGKRI